MGLFQLFDQGIRIGAGAHFAQPHTEPDFADALVPVRFHEGGRIPALFPDIHQVCRFRFGSPGTHLHNKAPRLLELEATVGAFGGRPGAAGIGAGFPLSQGLSQ